MVTVSTTDDQFIEKLNRIICARMSDSRFRVSELAREMGMSRSTLQRKVRETTGKNLKNLISETRLKWALQQLKTGKKTVSEIAWDAGFASSTYFIKCFHDYFGFSPGEIKNNNFLVNHFDRSASDSVTTNSGPSGKEKKYILLLPKRIPFSVKLLLGFIILSIIIIYYLKPDRQYLLLNIGTKDKSIAVLPFVNDTSDSTNIYFINGVTEAIIDRLAQINDLKITSRISTEKYRNIKTKSARQIARELKVTYVLEGSVQRINDSVLVSVQLIEGFSDTHILSRRYEGKFTNVFRLYNEIALDVAAKIKSAVAKSDKLTTEKPAMENLVLKKMLIQGNQLLEFANLQNESTFEQMKQAERNFRDVISIDPENQEALRELGNVFLAMNTLDSALHYALMALRIDDNDVKTLLLLGNIYCLRHDEQQMEKYINLALKYDPQDPWVIQWKGALYYYRGEFENALKYLLLARNLMEESYSNCGILELRRQELVTLHLFRTLFALGFCSEAEEISKDWLKLSNPGYNWMKTIQPDLDRNELWKSDSLGLIYNLLWAGFVNQKFEQTYNYGIENSPDALNVPRYHLYMGINLLFMNKYDEASGFFMTEIELNKKRNLDEHETDFLYGFTLIKKHEYTEGKKYLKSTIDYYESLIVQHPELTTPDHFYAITDRYSSFPYFMLTTAWAALGNKDKALHYLRLLRVNWLANDLQVVTFLTYFPMFENIRDEPEFQQYLKEATTHYQNEYKKVKILLRKENIIIKIPSSTAFLTEFQFMTDSYN